jgi:hypothetical protein
MSHKILVRESSMQLIVGYMRWILYILADFQVVERLHSGPEFSHDYLIDYQIITLWVSS